MGKLILSEWVKIRVNLIWLSLLYHMALFRIGKFTFDGSFCAANFFYCPGFNPFWPVFKLANGICNTSYRFAEWRAFKVKSKQAEWMYALRVFNL